MVSTARARSRRELFCFVSICHCACLDSFICLDGNRLYFKCASLPPAALLYIGACIFAWRRCTQPVRSGCRVRWAAFSQQHRRDYDDRRLAVIRAGNHLGKKDSELIAAAEPPPVVASPDSCQCRPASQGPSRSMDDDFLKEDDEWRVQGRAFGGSRPKAVTDCLILGRK